MTTTPNLARPWGLLEPDAWKSGTSGSEGAGAQQCAPATRRFYPTPAKETADPQWVRYEFDPPPGNALYWSFDVRTGPNQIGSYRHYRVRVVDETGRVLAQVRHSMLVVP